MSVTGYQKGLLTGLVVKHEGGNPVQFVKELAEVVGPWLADAWEQGYNAHARGHVDRNYYEDTEDSR